MKVAAAFYLYRAVDVDVRVVVDVVIALRMGHTMVKNKIYAGIGSRETPEAILRQMQYVGAFLGQMGWKLRSGGARGADSAFEYGCDATQGEAEIYLPWVPFQGRFAGLSKKNPHKETYAEIPDRAYEIAAEIHPAWERLFESAKKLHARNVLQVLGMDLKTPAERIICWTPGGKDVGGTRTALVLGRRVGCEIQNLNSVVSDALAVEDF